MLQIYATTERLSPLRPSIDNSHVSLSLHYLAKHRFVHVGAREECDSDASANGVAMLLIGHVEEQVVVLQLLRHDGHPGVDRSAHGRCLRHRMAADRGVLTAAATALHAEGVGVGARELLRLLRVGRVRHLTRHDRRNSASRSSAVVITTGMHRARNETALRLSMIRARYVVATIGPHSGHI